MLKIQCVFQPFEKNIFNRQTVFGILCNKLYKRAFFVTFFNIFALDNHKYVAL